MNVSVVIPVYNRTQYLGLTLESVRRQTYAAWEALVVDDGSSEDVGAVVARCADPRIRLTRQANQGNAAARNAGIGLTQGPYVALLDSDDCWEPEMLEACVSALEAEPGASVAYVGWRQVDAEGKTLRSVPAHRAKSGDLLEALLLGEPILPSSAVVRRRCFERWGVYTPGLDDWELWLRFAKNGCQFRGVERTLLNYRIHDQNLNLSWQARRAVHFEMLDAFYAQAPVPERARRLRPRAYAQQHLTFAVSAWQAGRAADGQGEFAEALACEPRLAEELETYGRIACAHQGREVYGSAEGFDMDRAEECLLSSVQALAARDDLPAALARRRAAVRARAYFVLGMYAYGHAQDMPRARRWLRASLRAWPAIALRTRWAGFMLRALVLSSPPRRRYRTMPHG